MEIIQEAAANHCPFKCEPTQLDELGMCAHVVGFATVDPNAPPGTRQTLEPLEAALRKRKDPDTGRVEEVETGFLRVNGQFREYVQKGDLLVNPETPQKDHQTGLTHMHHLWFSARVYHEHPETRVPQLCPQPKRVIKARPKRKVPEVVEEPAELAGPEQIPQAEPAEPAAPAPKRQRPKRDRGRHKNVDLQPAGQE